MGHDFVLANIDRAGDHAAVVGVMVAVAAVGALAYGLVRLVGSSRARRTRSDRSREDARRPKA